MTWRYNWSGKRWTLKKTNLLWCDTEISHSTTEYRRFVAKPLRDLLLQSYGLELYLFLGLFLALISLLFCLLKSYPIICVFLRNKFAPWPQLQRDYIELELGRGSRPISLTYFIFAGITSVFWRTAASEIFLNPFTSSCTVTIILTRIGRTGCW